MSKPVTIMRKRISNRKWLEKRKLDLLKESHEWHTFEQFDCSSFFKGPELATHNRSILVKNLRRVRRQLNFINELLKAK